MTKNNLTELLKHYHIADYLIMRLVDNAHLYRHRIDEFNLGCKNVALFRVLYVILAQNLSQGHTVIRLDDDFKDVLLTPSFEILSDFLDFDVAKWADERASIHTTKQSESKYADNLKQFKQKAENKNLNIPTIKLLEDFAVDLARLIYILREYDLNNLNAFCQRLSHHPLVAMDLSKTIDSFNQKTFPQCPIVLRHDKGNNKAYLWLQRAWQAEYRLAYHVGHLVQADNVANADDIARRVDFSHMELKDEQKRAIMTALNHRFALITGGPGTGKTHTVAHLVMILSQFGNMGELALVAPTGKAAQRMQESLARVLSASKVEITLPEAKTIHRLLGIGRDGQAYYNADTPLSEDVIIVDEASMLGVELACALFSAVPKGGRVILLGDVNQLAAVEAGAVLADLCKTRVIDGCHANLVESTRFDKNSGIGKLAQAIQTQDSTQAMTVMNTHHELGFVDIKQAYPQEIYDKLLMGYQAFFDLVQAHIGGSSFSAEVADIFKAFNAYRILCASHLGNYGDDKINEYLVNHHKALIASHARTQKNRSNFWYHGRAVMINKNDYSLGLFNGDVGICLGVHNPRVYFEHKPDGIDVSLMTEEMVNTAYAMTVHKSQGSEFENVAVVFDDTNTRLLTKELIYTAITRAKTSLTIYSTEPALHMAITTPTERQTGLDLHL